MQRQRPERYLSRPLGEMKSDYEVVVVGTGYGGSIAASRLSRAGRKVCVLERGREFQPGEYPDKMSETNCETQVDQALGHTGSKLGLFDFRMNDDIHVLVGCGLGGTSLINANVVLKAEPRVFDEHWPVELRSDPTALLSRCYQRAQDMLSSRVYPEETPGFPKLAKTEANRKAAAHLGERCDLTPIAVNFTDFAAGGDGRNQVGVPQQPCANCGDCVTGCNYGAKNTVLMNYLPDAVNHGAEIFTQVSVRWVQRHADGRRWMVFFEPQEMGRECFGGQPMFVTADRVVLAAGSLGSTEILLRSREHSLSVSPHLGRGFTGNGDALGFAYNCDQPIHGIGFGENPVSETDPCGPCITSVIDAREKPELNTGAVIEDGSIPGALRPVLSAAFSAAAAAIGEDTDHGFADTLREWGRQIQGWFGDGGATDHTQTMLVMCHDDSAGVMALQDDRLRIRWPDVGEQPIFGQVNRQMEQASEALGGTFLRNPLWTDLLQKQLITVHPLGGCGMADDASKGVVNHRCQVFQSEAGASVHEGLFVMDGSVMPRSLGVNPLLTISALSERACELLILEQGWPLNLDPHKPASPPGIPRRIGFRFTESMVGTVARVSGNEVANGSTPQDLELFQQARRQIAPHGSEMRFVMTVESRDLQRFVEEREHLAALGGTVSCLALSAQSLTASQGSFNLFVEDDTEPQTRWMKYRTRLTSVEGRAFWFEGFKRIHDDTGFDVWTDTTTLYTTIRDADAADAPVLLQGVLHIEVTDFVRQLRTMEITHANGLRQKAEGAATFLKFFLGALWKTYGLM